MCHGAAKISFMKKILLIAIAGLYIQSSSAQFINQQKRFPSGISIVVSGRAPFRNAIWIGPEWRWNGYDYDCIPGHWVKRKHKRNRWIQGYWKNSRRGYIWVPGRWG